MMESKPLQINSILAIIVLYNSTLEMSSTFKSLILALPKEKVSIKLMVYNNSPSYWSYDGKLYEGLELIYREDPTNSGVSRAYNQAYECAVEQQKSYLLLLDQDTNLPSNFFDALNDANKKYNEGDIGLFCPKVINEKSLLSPAKFFLFTSKLLPSIEEGPHLLKGLAIINSGLVISTRLFNATGGFNEKIKLDFSDFDFLKRALSYTKEIIVINALCRHSLSSEDEVPLKSALVRFGYYVRGAIHYKKSYLSAVGLTIWVIMRMAKLNLKYRTFRFTTVALNVFKF
jgi:rhamnosyltransferase